MPILFVSPRLFYLLHPPGDGKISKSGTRTSHCCNGFQQRFHATIGYRARQLDRFQLRSKFQPSPTPTTSESELSSVL